MTSRTPLSTADLLEGLAAGKRYKYVFFWGDTPARDGEVDKSCLSQWFVAPSTVDGVRYATAEHWMMAGKARLFGDDQAAAKVIAAGHPSEAKAIGRTVSGFDTDKWQQHRFELVVEGNVHKFGQNQPLLDYLLGTGDRVLVEASPVDRIWGIGLAAGDERAEHPAEWRGLNLLGFALMQARLKLADTHSR
ncbi:NADAR family protein [Kribbella sancticallisti]|uniref:NADAR family protein n=1 Tax=Kribbella sancticallisti TaxID=460087 RepID=A0ABN2ER24_9ACTN